MYTGLLHSHRLFAYLFLIAAVAAVGMALQGWISKRPAQNAWDRRAALFALIFGHLQLLFGLALYFVGPWFNQLTTNTAEVMKNADLRWFAVFQVQKARPHRCILHPHDVDGHWSFAYSVPHSLGAPALNQIHL